LSEDENTFLTHLALGTVGAVYLVCILVVSSTQLTGPHPQTPSAYHILTAISSDALFGDKASNAIVAVGHGLVHETIVTPSNDIVSSISVYTEEIPDVVTEFTVQLS